MSAFFLEKHIMYLWITVKEGCGVWITGGRKKLSEMVFSPFFANRSKLPLRSFRRHCS